MVKMKTPRLSNLPLRNRTKLPVSALALGGLVLLLVACGEPQSVSPSSTNSVILDAATPVAESISPDTLDSESIGSNDSLPSVNAPSHKALPPPHYGAATASVEERIHDADVVVRASLRSTDDNILRFRAIEYLKGTGPSTFGVRVPTASRNTTWDKREAILFLIKLQAGVEGASTESSPPEAAFVFAETADEHYRGDLPSGYGIDTRNPVWLPERVDGISGASGSGVTFITGSSNLTQGAGPVISLAELRSKIAWVVGSGNVKGYDECIKYSIEHRKRIRDWEVYYARRWSPYQSEVEVPSGANAVLNDSYFSDGQYVRFWLSSDDADLFSVQIVDDDSVASNGYRRTVTTARPLANGTYKFNSHARPSVYWPCNYSPEESHIVYLVNATAPADTVHESFFDPVAIDKAVGADGTNGVLSPSSFSLAGRDSLSTLTKVVWESGRATLELEPSVSLQGYHADFISMDGSTALRLDFDDGRVTVNGTKGTITWNVCKRPWESGNLFMLRISKSGQNLTGVTNDGPCKQNSG